MGLPAGSRGSELLKRGFYQRWGLAMISLWNIEHAARELERCRKAGLRGATIGLATAFGPAALRSTRRYSYLLRALRYSINVTLDGCCDLAGDQQVGAQRRFSGCAQERALEGATPQGDAPCPRYRKGPIRLYWFMASG
jgi:hypothetical protein